MRSKFLEAILTGVLLLSASYSYSQSYVQSAGQFSRITPGGSARIQALGGTNVALGGDYSSALSNPAGLGFYNRNEISLSHGLNVLNTNSQYLGTTTNDSKVKLNIPGFSIVLHLPKTNSDYRGGSIAISLSRINDFNQTIRYSGFNTQNSIIDDFVDVADSYNNPDPKDIFGKGDPDYNLPSGPEYNSPTGLAYYNYLIGPKSLLSDPDTGPASEYFSDVTYWLGNDNTIDNLQTEEVKNAGSSNQWNFSYGGNFKDKFFFGAGIGVTSIKYKSIKTYSEAFDNNAYLSNLGLQETLDVKGSGVNATIGMTSRPVNFIQFGLSFTTPTMYWLYEKYDAVMNTNWKDFVYFDGTETITLNNEFAATDIVTSDYTLMTPAKLSGGLAFISKFGLISGDIEYVNAKHARYDSNEGPSFSNTNSEIRSSYKPTVNYRLGAEFRYEIFRVRAGFGVQGNTMANSGNFDNTVTSVSGGFGIKTRNFFADFALINSRGDNYYNPYSYAPSVEIKNNMVRGVVTVGLTF